VEPDQFYLIKFVKNKESMKKMIIAVIGLLVVAGIGFWILQDRESAEQTTFTKEESAEIAQNWVLNQSPTYIFDGMDLTPAGDGVIQSDYAYEFLFTFESRGGGYGDRTDQMITQAITPHDIRVVVSGGEVISAVTDGVFDEIAEEMLSGTAPMTSVSLFFVQVDEDGQEAVEAVERSLRESADLAQRTLQALLQGPNANETGDGFTTTINEGVTIQSFEIEDGVASVDFNQQLQEGVAGSAMVIAIREQIEKTLLQFDNINEVIISIDGDSEEILQP